jgi:hypothetical protein
MTAFNSDFGIRNNGDRAAVLTMLLGGKPQTASKLALLVRGKTTTRVARIVRRIEAKVKLYRLPYKVLRTEAKNGERVYALLAKK